MKAAIDIGSNTVHLLVGKVENQKVSVVLQAVRTTRLGEGCKNKVLLPVSMDRTVNALVDFQQILQEYGIKTCPKIVATSAVREAKNGGVLLEKILEKTGWPVKLVSGEEEAMLSYAGATSLFADVTENSIVVDIGGGSTEFIWQENRQIQAESIPLGIVRVEQEQLDVENIGERITPIAEKIKTAHGKNPLQVIAVGGTATDVSAALLGIREYRREKVHGYQLTKEALAQMKEELLPLTGSERREKYPILGERAAIIIGGLNILMMILQKLEISYFTVSDAGILDGLLLQP